MNTIYNAAGHIIKVRLLSAVICLIPALSATRSQSLPADIDESAFRKSVFEEAKINKKDAWVFFTQYPYNSGIDGNDGNVFVSFIVRKNGQLDSIQFLNNPGGLFKNTTLDALNKSSGTWEPCNFDGILFDKKYIAGFNFTNSHSFFYKKYKGLKLLRKGQNERSLRFINQALKINPYDTELYLFRARIYKKQSKNKFELSDLKTIEKLDNNLLFNIWF